MNRVYWNSFATELFLSCSADWSVRLWNQEITTPIQTFKGAQVLKNEKLLCSPVSMHALGHETVTH